VKITIICYSKSSNEILKYFSFLGNEVFYSGVAQLQFEGRREGIPLLMSLCGSLPFKKEKGIYIKSEHEKEFEF